MEIEHKQDRQKKINAEKQAETWLNVADKFLPMGSKRKRGSSKKSGMKGKKKGIVMSREDVEKSSDKEPSRSPLHVAGALVSLPVTFPLVIAAKSKHSSFAAKANGNSITRLSCMLF